MSYSEENGLVILSMSREDHDALLIRMGIAAGYFAKRCNTEGFNRTTELLNRLEEGNRNYTPYQVSSEKPHSSG